MRRLIGFVLTIAALCGGAAPAMPAPAPVEDEIPVALLVDLSTGQTLFAREPDRRFVPASVTKVMTAYTAFKLIDEGKLQLDRQYQYTEELQDAWYGEGSNMFLLAGERPTVGQLLLGITTVSGNDASVALAVGATGSLERWLGLMNENAAELGMRNTHFGSPNGFPDGGKTYTSARDLVLLAEAITQRYPGLYRRYFGHRQLTWRNITQRNHDPVTGAVEGADGIKTGYTSEAGYTFLGSAERDSRRLVVVLAGAPSERVRNQAARDMLEWGFADFEKQFLFAQGAPVGTAQVQDGAQRSVALRLPREFAPALPVGEAGEIAMALSYRGPVAAPIAEGDIVARLELRLDGRTVLTAPLEAAESVDRANAFQRIGNAFAAWLD